MRWPFQKARRFATKGRASPSVTAAERAQATDALIDAVRDYTKDPSKDPHPSKQAMKEAVMAARRLADGRAVLPLIELLEVELKKDPELTDVIAGEIAGTLGDLGDRRAVPVLIKALSYSRIDVPRIAADSLAKLRDPRAVEPLIELFGDDWDEVRDAARGALARFGAAAVEPLVRALRTPDTRIQTVDGELVLAMESSRIRNYAVELLGQIGDTRAAVPIIEALPTLNLKIASVALASLGESRLSSCLQGVGDWHRLGESRDPRVLPPLLRVLSGPSEAARGEAARGLGDFGDLRAVDALIAALEDKSVFVRREAVGALVKLGDLRALEPIIRVLRDADASVRERALDALAAFGGTRALQAISEQLPYDFRRAPGTRWAAIAALGKMRDRESVEPILKRLLEDRDEGIRQAAAESLETLRNRRS